MADLFSRSVLTEFAPPGFSIIVTGVFEHPDGKRLTKVVKVGVAGKGAAATVYFAKEVSTGRRFAVRVSDGGHNVKTHLDFAKFGIAPKLYYDALLFYKNTNTEMTIVVMEEISSTLAKIINGPKINVDRIGRALECILDKKYLLRILHGDFHTENIVVLKDGRTMGLIDFDFSMTEVDPIVNILDFIPLLAGLKTRANTNSIKLLNYMLKYYKDTFDISIKVMSLRGKRGGGYEYVDNGVSINSYVKIPKLGMRIKNAAIALPNFKEPLLD